MTIVKNKHTDKYIPYFNGKYILLHEIMEFVSATVIHGETNYYKCHVNVYDNYAWWGNMNREGYQIKHTHNKLYVDHIIYSLIIYQLRGDNVLTKYFVTNGSCLWALGLFCIYWHG